MYELLRSFTAVLDEFGVSHGRAKQAARCAAEGLMLVCAEFTIPYLKLTPLQCGAEIKANTSANVAEIISSIQAYMDSIADSKGLVQPVVKLHSMNEQLETADEVCILIIMRQSADLRLKDHRSCLDGFATIEHIRLCTDCGQLLAAIRLTPCKHGYSLRASIRSCATRSH